jgi:FkbM family methyltransferase
MTTTAKDVLIASGLYRTARIIQRRLNPSARRRFLDQKGLYSQFVKRGDLVFDVGANIGERTAVFLALGCRVVSFEPQPSCAKEVRARNNGMLRVEEKAVGASEGRAKLFLKKSDTLASLVHGWQGEDVGTIDVQVTTLDAAISQFGQPTFCKIDVEGFEAQVLQGLSHPIPMLSFEFHVNSDAKAAPECIKILSNLGPVKINAVGGEGCNWILSNWISQEQFTDTFPECVAPNIYGDIFAKLDHR